VKLPLLVACFGLSLSFAAAGDDLPVLRAHSRAIDIRDGDRFLKGVWSADPSVALDVYEARRSVAGKRVTFISDVDSLAFDVEPGGAYDFVVLLDGKDACRSRLSTLTRVAERRGAAAGPVEIPLSIRGGKLHLAGTFNDSQPLDLIFDTGADTHLLYPSAREKGAELRLDGNATNRGTGGTTVRRIAGGNRLEISDLRWRHEPIILVEKQADDADGIVGYSAFEDRVVELDFDRMVMRVHDALPPVAAGFVRVPMPDAGSLTAVEVRLGGEGGLFVLDTAGTGALMVNRAFAGAHGLPGALRVLGSSSSRGVGSGVVRNSLVLAPELSLAGATLRDVPIDVELPGDGEAAPPGGALCMEVLQRFDAIFDYPDRAAYFRPNARFGEAFPSRGMRRAGIAAIGVGIGVLALLVIAVVRRKNRRRVWPRA